MNALQLLAHFDRISEAPDATPCLRRFILRLAVRGKLVEQDPHDKAEPEVMELGSSGDRERHFNLPHQWVGVAIGKALSFEYGKGLPANERSVSGSVPVFGSNGLVGYCAKPLTELPSIIIGRKGSAGALNLCNGPSWTTDVAYFVNPPSFLNIHFLLLILEELDLARLSKGVKPGLSRSDVYPLTILIPPLAEQHRIVAKVEELTMLCDRYGAAQVEREYQRDRLTATSLNRLNHPESVSAKTFRDHVRFHLRHFPQFTTRPDQIPQLRQTILTLAVIGRLTKTVSGARSACDELKEVEERKQQLALRKRKHIAPITAEEKWIELPEGWVWARWDQITDWITYGFTRPMPHSDEGIPIVTGKNVNGGQIIFSTAHKTTAEAYAGLNDKDRPMLGDILITKDGSIGRSAIVETEEPFCINQSVAVLWLRSCHLNRRFLQLAIDCPQTQQTFLRKTEGVAIKHISVVDVGKMVFPLPPLAEQDCIVDKVNELFAICDQLESQITVSRTETRHLLEALLNETIIVAA